MRQLVNFVSGKFGYDSMEQIISEIKNGYEPVCLINNKGYMVIYRMGLDEENVENSFFYVTKIHDHQYDCLRDIDYKKPKYKMTYAELKNYGIGLKVINSYKVV